MVVKIGDLIDGYRVTGYINDGGMSKVWSIEKDGRNYARKMCLGKDEHSLKRFDREYRLMKSLDNPHVLKAYNKGAIDGFKYIIVEKADHSWKDLVEKGLTLKDKFDFII